MDRDLSTGQYHLHLKQLKPVTKRWFRLIYFCHSLIWLTPRSCKAFQFCWMIYPFAQNPQLVRRVSIQWTVKPKNPQIPLGCKISRNQYFHMQLLSHGCLLSSVQCCNELCAIALRLCIWNDVRKIEGELMHFPWVLRTWFKKPTWSFFHSLVNISRYSHTT